MSDKNYVFIGGNLTRDAELKYTASGMAVLKCSVACNRSHKKPDDTWENIASFFDVTWFGKMAEKKVSSLVKGVRVDITGSLNQERWEQDGQARSKVAVIAENIEIIHRVKDGSMAPPEQQESGSDNGVSDDIPF